METPVSSHPELSHADLPVLPYDHWRATKDTLHLYCQIVGKIRLASTPWRNHWWNVPLYVTARGLSTGRMEQAGHSFDLEFDFARHALVLRDDRGDEAVIPLRHGLTVADFHDAVFDRLADMGLHPTIVARPFGLPVTTPFARDREHADYDPGAVARFWHVLRWTDTVLERFSGRFTGKTSRVHLFWHSFDLALNRFSGRSAPAISGADPVTRSAYSHELISFGFWPGDPDRQFPAFYSYTAPEPSGLRRNLLRPEQATWTGGDGASLAVLRYDDVRKSDDPELALTDFYESAYVAGADAAGWDRSALAAVR